MSDAAWTAISLVAVAIITSIIAPMIAGRSTAKRVESTIGQKITETHRAVTVNHHSSAEPTVLDRLSDLEALVRDGFDAVHTQLGDGGERFERIERTVGLAPWREGQRD
jgi:LytS/YehU family sensor histidine kinase